MGRGDGAQVAELLPHCHETSHDGNQKGEAGVQSHLIARSRPVWDAGDSLSFKKEKIRRILVGYFQLWKVLLCFPLHGAW